MTGLAEIDGWLWVALGLAAFFAGTVDAAAGGGGLIQVPALLLAFPHEPLANLFGTNKLASVVGTTAAGVRYLRRVAFPGALLAGVVGAAAVGSFLGASAVTHLPQAVVRPLVALLLAAVALYTFWNKGLGVTARAAPLRRWEIALAVGAAAVIGAYDGFLGPGTGSFLIFAFVRGLHFDFLQASALAKVANVATNVAAIGYFSWQAEPLWVLGAWMAGCNLLGAFAGTWLAFRVGSRWLRRLFLVVVVLTLLRLAGQSML